MTAVVHADYSQSGQLRQLAQLLGGELWVERGTGRAQPGGGQDGSQCQRMAGGDDRHPLAGTGALGGEAVGAGDHRLAEVGVRPGVVAEDDRGPLRATDGGRVQDRGEVHGLGVSPTR